MDNEKGGPRTVRDALILEALGDIGVLLGNADELNRTVAPLVAALQQAQAETLAAVERHANSQKLELHTVAEQEKAALEKLLYTAVAKAAKELEQAGGRMARELERPPGLPPWKQAAIALAIALVASLVGIVGTYWLYGRGLESEAALGRAVMAVWEQLDEKTQARIERAF